MILVILHHTSLQRGAFKSTSRTVDKLYDTRLSANILPENMVLSLSLEQIFVFLNRF